MDRIIKSIEIVRNGAGSFTKIEVGQKFNDKIIHRISDNGIESENGNMYCCYVAKDIDGVSVICVENCPVVVIYK